PGAEGWGADASGGRGGRVIAVTTLNEDGPGSLRAAMCDTGKRIIVFKVSGVINLTTKPKNSFAHIFQDTLNSNFTLAGQTSPGGITVTGTSRILGSLAPEYSSTGVANFIIRFVRFRCTRDANLTCGSSNYDAIEYSDCSNFIIDHCDVSGGDDGTFDVTGSKYYTIQWSTITNSTYRCGDHGGSLFAYAPTHHVTIHHNLWAHHEVRAGLFHWGGLTAESNGQIDYFNNVTYNMWDFSLMIQDGGAVHFNCVGNTFVEGPNNQYYNGENPEYTSHNKENDIQVQSAAIGYFRNNNIYNDDGTVTVHDSSKVGGTRATSRFDMGPVTTHTAVEAFDKVLRSAGLWYQDSMNKRVEFETRTRTGRHRNNVAPFVMEGPASPTDTDNDGMPDFWEDAVGLNKNSASDATGDFNSDGYTNIEKYLNDLALARLGESYKYSADPIPAAWKVNPIKRLKIAAPVIWAMQGDAIQLSVSKKYSYYDSSVSASMSELSWTIANPSAATISSSGLFNALLPTDSLKIICYLTSQPSVADTIYARIFNKKALNPVADAVADWGNKAINYGKQGTLTIKTAPVYISATTGYDVKRSFLKFDLKSLPVSRSLLRAELVLNIVGINGSPAYFPMAMCTTANDWKEDSLTWLTEFPLLPNSWKYDWRSEVRVDTLYAAPVTGRQSWDVTSFMSSRLSRDTITFFLSKFKTGTNWISFAGKDTSITELRPELRLYLVGGTSSEDNLAETGEQSMSVVPNPFNPVTKIVLNNVRKQMGTSLKIYNVSGKCVANLTNDIIWKNNGAVAAFNASKLCSGMYVVKLDNGGTNIKVKAMVVK
ncbi:MAG: DNRLRE domain-containing protein, partial [Fibrobacteres bacterium]|nr:DNRLRE domain-containing protein [Fibrobacterota bacterium]